jgi:hypothetical protein
LQSQPPTYLTYFVICKIVNMQLNYIMALVALNHVALSIPVQPDASTEAEQAIQTEPPKQGGLSKPICEGTIEACEPKHSRFQFDGATRTRVSPPFASGLFSPGKQNCAECKFPERTWNFQMTSPTGGAKLQPNSSMSEPTASLEVDGPDASQIMIETFQSPMPEPTAPREEIPPAEPTATGEELPTADLTDTGSTSEPTASEDEVSPAQSTETGSPELAATTTQLEDQVPEESAAPEV